jgi:tripartite motif-containing protein 71
VDTAGYAYVADTPTSGGASGRVQKFNVSSPSTALATWGGAPGTGNGLVDFPEGVTFDSSGNIYVVDTKHDRIQKFDATGNYLLQWGGTGTASGQFMLSNGGAFGIAVDSTLGRVYVVDSSWTTGSGYGRVQEFDTSGNFLKVLATPGAGQLQVSNPESVAVDSSGNVYIADSGNYRIEVINSSGYYVRSIGGGYGSPPSDGQFTMTVGVAVDSTGNVYVSDAFGDRVQKFNSQGTYVSKLASVGSGNGQVNLPFGIAVDKADNLYIADLGNSRIDKFDSAGNFLGSFGGAGVGNGTFGYPVDVAVDASGNVVTTDVANNLIQEFAPTF